MQDLLWCSVQRLQPVGCSVATSDAHLPMMILSYWLSRWFMTALEETVYWFQQSWQSWIFGLKKYIFPASLKKDGKILLLYRNDSFNTHGSQIADSTSTLLRLCHGLLLFLRDTFWHFSCEMFSSQWFYNCKCCQAGSLQMVYKSFYQLWVCSTRVNMMSGS